MKLLNYFPLGKPDVDVFLILHKSRNLCGKSVKSTIYVCDSPNTVPYWQVNAQKIFMNIEAIT